MLLDAQPEHITPPPPPHIPATGVEKQSSPQPEGSGPKRDRPLSSIGKDRANPIDLDDFDEGDSEQHEGRTSDDEPLDPGKENLVFGTEFKKVAQYDHCLDEGDNPWNIALHRPLYPSQVIGFRWMLDRHRHGGGLVADKVGCGKVVPVLAKDLIHRPIRRRISS